MRLGNIYVVSLDFQYFYVTYRKKESFNAMDRP